MKLLKIQKSMQTKPNGWIKEQMNNDLVNGFVGHLHKLVPSLFAEDDIYGMNRRGKIAKAMDLGLAKDDKIDDTQLQWWNSESQSQWYDGLIRHSYLLENKDFINMCNEYIAKMLSYQDEDGYMGIYDESTRYNFTKESGELWAQATLFRAILSYYDATNDMTALNAVIRAVDVTMQNYDEKRESIFSFEQSHGLMFTDVLDRLFSLTNDIKYMNYADYLYKQLLNSECKMEVDVKEKDIMDEQYRLKGHGVHTYEHLRTLVTLAFSEYNNHEMKEYYLNLYNKYFEKIVKCISPSGGPIGDEWVSGHYADASMTGYEYCSIQELMHTYIFLLEKTNDLQWADKIEHIVFNAAQGARHNEESSVAYLKSDNSYSMEGGFQYVQEDCQHKAQIRYKYSPTHQDAAVCCVPNAGRIMPYYIQSQWLQNDSTLLKATYGAGIFKTNINGIDISIEEKSDYPFCGKMIFIVEVSSGSGIDMDIAFRIPSWCKNYTLKCDKSHRNEKDRIVFSGTWKATTIIEINFELSFITRNDLLGDWYFSYGAMVLALPIKGEQKTIKEYGISNLRDVFVTNAEDIPLYLCVDDISLSSLSVICDKPGWDKMKFEINFMDKDKNIRVKRHLVPMGGTILRKVTFNGMHI